ncbi:hypothetical protein ACK359_15730, partial [Aeromonas veronii]
SVSHLVPSGSPFIGGKGVNHIQDGTTNIKKPAQVGFFVSVNRTPRQTSATDLKEFAMHPPLATQHPAPSFADHHSCPPPLATDKSSHVFAWINSFQIFR